MMMQLACSCCRQITGVTIKGIDKTDGTTVWEYGPGSYWRHHYGVDAISGVVPNLTATLNKYAIGAAAYPAYNACGNRNIATLAANCAEALTVTKLDSLDGTVSESAVLTGFFCDVIGETFVGLMTGLNITNAGALSGGDYVIVGERLPFIEFEDYSSNTATKSYILHAHGQQSGNVYLKTRTSSETITIPQNSTAAEVETLFEATADCVSATATGGPWPLLPITIEVEWSVTGGDIAAISATDTYSASGLGLDWEWEIVFIDDGIQALDVTINTLTVGAEFSFEFTIGETFSYTSTTDDVATFLAGLSTAMEAFAIAQGPDGAWESVVSGLPDSISITGNTIRIIYSSAIGIHPLSVTQTGGEGITDSRRAGSCAAAYDTGTGDMTSAVGYNFGYSEDRPTLRMFDDGGTNPTVTGLNVLGILSIGSGPDNAVIITPSLRGQGDAIKSNVVERWDISGGSWAFNWQVYCNADMAMPQIIPCESGYVMCEIIPKRFGDPFTGDDRTAARIAVADTAIVEITRRFASLSTGGAIVSRLYDGLPDANFSGGYALTEQDSNRPNNRFRTTASTGDNADLNGTFLRLDGIPFGADGSSVFGTSYGATTGFRYEPSFTYSNQFIMKCFPPPLTRSDEPQQFRFKFANNATTAWLDWYATASEIRTALLDLMGENSDPPGFPSNVQVFDWPDLPMENDPYPTIEARLQLTFQVAISPGSLYVDPAYFSSRVGDITIELQNVTAISDPAGISAYDITGASLIWSRAFGTKGAITISQPQYAWLQGDFVYAYGSVVDAEL